jgi:hypothetical protein
MLSPSEYEHLCDQLITLYDDLDNAIINDMVKRMMKTGKVTEATAWQAKQLQQSGMLYEDILEEIAKRTNATRNQVRTLFEDAGVQSIRNDNRSYKAAGLETIVKMSDAALQTLNAGYKKCMGDLSNLTLTTANTSQTAYIKACNLAYMEVTSGTMDYGTAIRRAVQSVADEGSWILYPSGHRDRLDVAVRRSVLTGVGQTVRKISEINANDMDCDIMEITAHAGARPSHAEWQGQFASLSGKNAGRKIDGARVYSLKEIGYGTGDGFGGWNCRHDWFPFFEGISSRAYSNQRLKDLNAKNIEYNGKMYSEYEIDQMQRALERKVRERKRAVSAADTAVKNAPDDTTANQMKAFFTEQSVKLKQAEKNLSDFISATGNLPDGTRTWVNGFGRSTAQKAVWANRKAQPQLHMAAISKNSSKGSGGSGQNSQSDSSTFDRVKNKISGNNYLNKISDFHEHLPKMQNKTVSSLLQRTYDRTVFEKSRIKKSYFSNNDGKVYIRNSTIPSTVAHELFHKIDFDNNISRSGMLDRCIKSDYENLRKIAENAGLSIEDMLYLNYPEAFEKKGRMKSEYRGVSDIIDGMTNGQIDFGYNHSKSSPDYWKNPYALQKETFAQYGRIYFEENADVLKMIQEIFPETSKEIKSIINVVNLYGR